jgi:hypothetical protein
MLRLVNFPDKRFQKRVVSSRAAMTHIAEQIAAFHADHGRLPESLQEAAICGPYIRQRAIADLWRRRYFYQPTEPARAAIC